MDEGLQWALGVETEEDALALFRAALRVEIRHSGFWALRGSTSSGVVYATVWTSPKFRGSGAGVRLFHEAVETAWNLGVHKVSVSIVAGNPSYRDPFRAMLHVGAEHEGTLKKHLWFRGAFRDVLMFAKFKEKTA